MAVNGGYRIFVHGGFANNAPASTPPAAWTPESLTGIQEWWYSGAGVVETSNQVQSWTGQINNTVLTKGTGTGMTYTAADAEANNKPTIGQNSSRNLATLINTNITTFTPTVERYLGFIGISNDSTSEVTRLIGGQTVGYGADGFSLMVDSFENPSTPGYYYTVPGEGTGRRTGAGTIVDGDVFWMIISIDSTGLLGTVNLNGTQTSINPNDAIDDVTPMVWEVGGYNNSPGPVNGPGNWNGKVIESFFGNGVPTSEDLTNLNTYVTNTYS